jgi:hypothetical protein
MYNSTPVGAETRSSAVEAGEYASGSESPQGGGVSGGGWPEDTSPEEVYDCGELGRLGGVT